MSQGTPSGATAVSGSAGRTRARTRFNYSSRGGDLASWRDESLRFQRNQILEGTPPPDRAEIGDLTELRSGAVQVGEEILLLRRVSEAPELNPTSVIFGTALVRNNVLKGVRNNILLGELSRGRIFHSSTFHQCPNLRVDITRTAANETELVEYQVHALDPEDQDAPTDFTVQTREIPEADAERPFEGMRNLDNLYLVSLHQNELPTYHYWAPPPETPLPAWKVIADRIDAATAAREAVLADDRANNPQAKLRKLPLITPTDPAWITESAIFRQILDPATVRANGRSLKNIMEVNFTEAQQLLLEPCTDNSARANLQELNTIKYRQLLQTRFRSSYDNIVTKFTMVRFGLPVEPLTLSNIHNAGLNPDKDDPRDDSSDDENFNKYQEVMFSSKPLEWLDLYDERGYGYPTLRKRKANLEYRIEPEFMEAVKRRKPKVTGREVDLSILKRSQFHCGTNSLHRDRRMSDDDADNDEFMFRLPGSMTGMNNGAGNPRPADCETFIIYTDFGVFSLENLKDAGATKTAFERVIQRVFANALQERPQPSTPPAPDALTTAVYSRYHSMFIDIVPNSATEGAQVSNLPFLYNEPWPLAEFEQNLLPALQDPDQRVRVRHGGQAQDPIEPPEFTNIVKLTMEDVGTAYWRLPSSASFNPGIQHYQFGFRLAIECLVTQHEREGIEWRLNNQSGKIDLSGISPSSTLCNAVIAACNARDPGQSGVAIEVNIALLANPTAPTQTSMSTPPILLMIPGDMAIISIPDRGAAAVAAIRRAVSEYIGSPVRIRLWSGVQRYLDNTDLDQSLLLEVGDENDDERWTNAVGNISNASHIIARPEFDRFRINDIQPTSLTTLSTSIRWGASPEKTLHSFLNALDQLWSNAISSKPWTFRIQLNSNRSEASGGPGYMICPEMTEKQWQVEVFDWFDNEDIYANRSELPAIEYPTSGGPRHPVSLVIIPEPTAPTVIRQQDINFKLISQLLPKDRVEVTTGEVRTAWDLYETIQRKADNSRFNAWTESQSVHQHSNPSIPRFGLAFQKSLLTGGSMPIVYSNYQVTASDSQRLQRTNEALENQILDRTVRCEVCTQLFPPGDHHRDEVRQHYKLHQEESRRAETCPICHRPEGWLGEDNNARVRHLAGCLNEGLPVDFAALRCPLAECREFIGLGTPFSNLIAINEHIKTHSLETSPRAPVDVSHQTFCPFPECGSDLTSIDQDGRRAHIISHSDDDQSEVENTYVCSSRMCENRGPFQLFAAFVQHINEQHPMCSFSNCTYHYPAAPTEDDLRQHHDANHSDSCFVPGCGHRFPGVPNDEDFGRHLQEFHPVPPYDPIHCRVDSCQKDWDMPRTVKQHVEHFKKQHPRRCPRPGCSYIWRNQQDETEYTNHFHQMHPGEFDVSSCSHKWITPPNSGQGQAHVDLVRSAPIVPLLPGAPCTLHNCNFIYPTNAPTEAERRAHNDNAHPLPQPLGAPCTIGGCNYVYPTFAPSEAERRAHNRDEHPLPRSPARIGAPCTFANCHHVYPTAVPTDAERRAHNDNAHPLPQLLGAPCTIGGCNYVYPTAIPTDAERQAHNDNAHPLPQPLGAPCTIGGCNYVYPTTIPTDAERQAHNDAAHPLPRSPARAGAPCTIANCDHVYPTPTPTDEERQAHNQAAHPPDGIRCTVIGCNHVYDPPAPTAARIAAHNNEQHPNNCTIAGCPFVFNGPPTAADRKRHTDEAHAPAALWEKVPKKIKDDLAKINGDATFRCPVCWLSIQKMKNLTMHRAPNNAKQNRCGVVNDDDWIICTTAERNNAGKPPGPTPGLPYKQWFTAHGPNN